MSRDGSRGIERVAWFESAEEEKEGSTMAGLEALQAVQFVTRKGKRFAVLSAEDWEALIEWLEILEDAQIAREAFAELKAAKGNRVRAGWRKWDEVESELA